VCIFLVSVTGPQPFPIYYFIPAYQNDTLSVLFLLQHFHHIFILGLCTMRMTGLTVACLRLQVPRPPVLHIYSGRPATNLQTTNLYLHGCSDAQNSLKASYLSILMVQKTSGFSCLRSSGAKRKSILGGNYLPFPHPLP